MDTQRTPMRPIVFSALALALGASTAYATDYPAAITSTLR